MRDEVDGAGAGFGGRPAHERAAVARRNVHRVLQADRREDALVVGREQALGEVAAFSSAGRSGLMSSTVKVCLTYGSGLVGCGCVGQLSSPGISRLRHRPFLDRPDRFARHAVEHVEPAGLVRRDDHVAVAAVVTDGRQLRRRARVEVPEVVVHELEVPEPLAGARIERHDRRAEEVRADAVGAVEVVGGRPERDVGDAALRCRSSSRPSCWCRRCTCRRPSARCRSRTRPAAARCGTSTPACR